MSKQAPLTDGCVLIHTVQLITFCQSPYHPFSVNGLLMQRLQIGEISQLICKSHIHVSRNVINNVAVQVDPQVILGMQTDANVPTVQSLWNFLLSFLFQFSVGAQRTGLCTCKLSLAMNVAVENILAVIPRSITVFH
jgi:hypothetical protein